MGRTAERRPPAACPVANSSPAASSCPGAAGRTTSPGLSTDIAQVVPTRQECDTNESNPMVWFEHDSTRVRTGGGMDGTAHLMASVRRAQGHIAAAGPSARIYLYGYASDEGSKEHNLDLSARRAGTIKSYLEDAGIDAARLEAVGMGEDASLPGRPLNRRVEICPTPAVQHIQMPAEMITADSVDCTHPRKAGTLTQYAFLVACLERLLAPTHGPVDILRTLREIYYGGSRFDEAACGDRESGTVAAVGLTTPALLTALKESKVTSGVDVGHLFTGLEGMLCPRTSTKPAWYAKVDMSNEDFLSWGGDIGSAAAGRLSGYNDSGLLFKTHPPWSDYFLTTGSLASEEDLLGDMDGFVWRANLKGVGCSATKDTRMPSPSAPVSQLLLDYYGAPPGAVTSLTSADRFRCFAEAIGATITGRVITNKGALVTRYHPQVYSFAHLFYLKDHVITMDTADDILLSDYARQVTRLFLNWVESKL
jgi:outer membrane protein OmpA-like peptidoglycan-associated protein